MQATGARPPFGSSPWPFGLARPTRTVLLTGGWVGATCRATLEDGRVVVVKRCPYPAEIEADGLAALAAAGVPVPEVLGVAGGTLVMPFVRGEPDWEGLGEAIARMHRCTAERFGWHIDNRAGRFLQPNAWADDWPTFFAEQRVRTHLSDARLPTDLRLRLERACDGPIQQILPARPIASLTHGDLWRGNIVDGRWVIDPEVSYADRELDLAYMRSSMTHPLPPEFWAAYEAKWPIADDFAERELVLGLHHRLLQVRHFGGSQWAPLDRQLTALGW